MGGGGEAVQGGELMDNLAAGRSEGQAEERANRGTWGAVRIKGKEK